MDGRDHMNEALIILLLAVAGITLASLFLKNELRGFLPITIIIISLILPIVFNMGIRIREVVEGPFAYYDILLSVICGNLFVYGLYKNGIFENVLMGISNSNSTPLSKSLKTSVLLALPAMLTGMASTSRLTTGKLFLTMQKEKTNIIQKINYTRIASFLGLIAPPLNLPAMIVIVSRSGSYPTSFEGYFFPMIIVSIPALIIHAIVSKDLFEYNIGNDYSQAKDNVQKSSYIPLIFVVFMVLAHNFLYKFVPFFGYPFIYIMGFILTIIFAPRKLNVVDVLTECIHNIALPLSFFIAMGSILEILTMLGVTGTLATIFAELNLITLSIPMLILTLISGLILGFTVGILVALLSSYIIGAISWTGISMSLLAIGIISCIPLLYCIDNNYESLSNTHKLKTILNSSVAYVIIICFVFVLLGRNLEILMF